MRTESHSRIMTTTRLDLAHVVRGGALLALLVVAGVPAAPAAGQVAQDAYVDAAARELVRLARARRETVDARILGYQATVRERHSIRAQAAVLEKLLYRRESVTRVAWERDGPTRMELLGARVLMPVAGVGERAPAEPGAFLRGLRWDPADPETLLLFDSTVVRHPLVAGSEADYRFASGDTAVIVLPGGTRVRVRELRILPRRPEPQLIAGSFWLEAETHALVQAYFRLAAPYDADLDASDLPALAHFIGITTDDGDPDDEGERVVIPGFLRPIRADLDFIALEYGLWDLTWWLPRRLAWRGAVRVVAATFPAAYERTYEDYTVRGDTTASFVPRPDSLPRGCRPVVRFVRSLETGAPADTARQARADSAVARRQRQVEAGHVPAVPPCPQELVVAAPSDSVLLASPELPADPYAGDLSLLSAADLEAIVARMADVPRAPCCPGLRFQVGPTGNGLVRYNRVEGLSLGARVLYDFGRARLSAEARWAFAEEAIRGDVRFAAGSAGPRLEVGAYRRLELARATTGMPQATSFLGALLLGRDERDYFDATGAEVVLRPRASGSQWFDLRLYAERQRGVARHAEFSVAHLVDGDRDFRENAPADAADQLGARLRLRGVWGADPERVRLSGEVTIGGQVGDFDLLRPEALVRFSAPLGAALSVGVEGAAGTVLGERTPLQALWQLGGAATLRGYAPGALLGQEYARGRAEVGWGAPALRTVLFGDAAWTGGERRFGPDDAPLGPDGALYSAGVGLSQMDGLVRVDLARGLGSGGRWRLHVQMGGIL